jgi:hypothetical protein
VKHLKALLGDEIPECIHDGDRRHEDTPCVDYMSYTQSCGECGKPLACGARPLHEPLLNTSQYLTPNTPEYFLYTRRGRLEIVIAALKDMGWPIPEMWIKNEY